MRSLLPASDRGPGRAGWTGIRRVLPTRTVLGRWEGLWATCKAGCVNPTGPAAFSQVPVLGLISTTVAFHVSFCLHLSALLSQLLSHLGVVVHRITEWLGLEGTLKTI